MCRQGCQGISQTGLSQNWIFPILDKASSLPSGWNLASSTTARICSQSNGRKIFKVGSIKRYESFIFDIWLHVGREGRCFLIKMII